MVIWKYDCASWRTIHFFFNWKLVSWHSIQWINPRRKWRLFPSFSQLNSETVDCSVTFSLKLRYFAWLIHFFDRIFLFTWLSAVCRANRVAERFCIRELFHIFWMLSRGPSALNSLACILNIRFFLSRSSTRPQPAPWVCLPLAAWVSESRQDGLSRLTSCHQLLVSSSSHPLAWHCHVRLVSYTQFLPQIAPNFTPK